MSVPPIVRRSIVVGTSLVLAASATAALTVPASAASRRCGFTGYERVFTEYPTSGTAFRISVYRKPPAKDPKDSAPRCVILWASTTGKGTLRVEDWTRGTTWSGSKNMKDGQRLEYKVVSPSGNVAVSGTFNRPGPGRVTRITEVVLSF